MECIKKQHLSFLFKIDLTTDFDNTLANFPSSRELARINWRYAVSCEMVMTCLQIMMALYASWNELGHLLPECRHSWNISKVPIDDLSKVLSHCLAKFGPISPLNVLWIQTFSTLLFYWWRSHCLAKSTDYMLG
jgi:hypothetical protein